MHKQFENLSTLINSLKSEDLKYKKISQAIQGMYWILVPLYVFMTVHDQVKHFNALDLISGICSILAFVIFALYFRFMYKEYNAINYDLPTIIMLKKALKRYKPFQKNTLWILFAVILIDLSISLSIFMELNAFRPIIIFQGKYLTAIALSAGLGLLIWGKKQKPLKDAIQNLINEIEA